MRKTDNGTVKCEHFDSVQEFIKFISEREPNKAFAKSNYYETLKWRFFSSVYGDENFTGTATWEDAQQLLKDGYAEGCKKILQGSAKLTMHNGARPRREVAMVGGQAHVPNAIIGLPKQMIRRVKQPKVQPTISIYYDCTAQSGVDAEVLFQGGANCYALVKHLEEKGVRVQLHVLKAGTPDGSLSKVDVATVKVKDFRQPINPLLVSYPLTHPSFFRRHLLRWVEVSDITDDSRYTDCYGYTLRYKYRGDYPAYLRQNNIIGKDDIYLDCESVAQCNHIESIINLANISAGHKVI